jgi:hypothetical protein
VDADKYRLSEADHQAIFDLDIKPDLFAGAKPSNQPVAVIFGGQPGSGKSAAVDAAVCDLECCVLIYDRIFYLFSIITKSKNQGVFATFAS